jgi:hypothetical protein
MSQQFKCLVEMNANKYSLIINNIIDNNSITFNDIYKKIRQMDTNVNISFETHLFQVSFNRLQNQFLFN